MTVALRTFVFTIVLMLPAVSSMLSSRSYRRYLQCTAVQARLVDQHDRLNVAWFNAVQNSDVDAGQQIFAALESTGRSLVKADEARRAAAKRCPQLQGRS